MHAVTYKYKTTKEYMHQCQLKHLALFSAARASCTDAHLGAYAHTHLFTSRDDIGLTIPSNAVVPDTRNG